MMLCKKTSRLPWLFFSVFIVLLDHLTKVGVRYWLDGSSILPVLPCVNLILVHNPGAAFSFLGGADGWQRWFFVAISLGVSIYLVRLLYQGEMNQWSACAVALIIGGALGNLVDRLTWGYVIDFIDFFIAHWHFATFNVADSAISMGAVMWIVANYKTRKKEQ